MEKIDQIIDKKMQILSTITAKGKDKDYYCYFADFREFNNYHDEYVITFGVNGKKVGYIDNITSLASVSSFDPKDPKTPDKIAEDAKEHPAKYVAKYFINQKEE